MKLAHSAGAATWGNTRNGALSFHGIDSHEVARTRIGTVAGTAGYMAPEQARGEVDQLDERTDIFALGAMLYELLAGSPPHNQANAGDRIDAAAEEAPIEAPAARLRKSNPLGAARVPRELRGNAWALQPVGLEATFRTSGSPDYFHATTGFRLAMNVRSARTANPF